MSFTDITTTLGVAYNDTFYVDANFIGNYYSSISIDEFNKQWYIKISGNYYKLINKHFFSVIPSTVYFWILDAAGSNSIIGQTLPYINSNANFDIVGSYGYIPPDSVLFPGSVTFGVSTTDFNVLTTGNETHNFSAPVAPQIFIRPKPYPNSIVYQVNSNAQLASSINLFVSGPCASNYSFHPTTNWYKYTVPGLTIGSNYSAYAYQLSGGGLSSLSVNYRTVQTGYLPGPVQNLTGTVNGANITLDWNFSASNGDATIKWHVIRDHTSTIKYNVLGTISTYTAPLLQIPGTNLFSVEAVNDPGYSPRMYASTVVV